MSPGSRPNPRLLKNGYRIPIRIKIIPKAIKILDIYPVFLMPVAIA